MNMGKEIYSILHLAFIIRGKIGSSYFLSVTVKALVKLKTGCLPSESLGSREDKEIESDSVF